MTKVLITCVNYNSYNELHAFLTSIDIATQAVMDRCTVQVVIADNSAEKQTIDTTPYPHIHCTVQDVPNNGYINSAQEAMMQYGTSLITEADFCIISNVDIRLKENFFVNLLATEIANIGWIAPRIYTPSTQAEENPQVLQRYSKRKLQLLKLLYTYPILSRCYDYTYHLIRRKHRNQAGKTLAKQYIYSGHGSIFIFTQAFMRHVFPFNFPCFLYGEEIFFAEKVRLNGQVTYFDPQIEVENTSAHVSTGRMAYNKRCRYSAIALDYILKTFY